MEKKLKTSSASQAIQPGELISIYNFLKAIIIITTFFVGKFTLSGILSDTRPSFAIYSFCYLYTIVGYALVLILVKSQTHKKIGIPIRI